MIPSITSKNLETSEILQKLIQLEEITVAELARRVNLAQPTIQRIVSGAYKQPRGRTLEPIAAYFKLTISQLRGIDPIPALSSDKKVIVTIPLISPTDILSWPSKEENFSQYVVCDGNLGKQAFSMYMPDRSMESVIPKGSTLIVDPSRTPHHGSYVVVKLHTYPEVIIRQLITDTANKYIKALSPELNHLQMTQLTNDDVIKGVIVEIRLFCEY